MIERAAFLKALLVATGGLGHELTQYQQSYSSTSAFALLAVIGILGITISFLLGIFERVALSRFPSGAGAGAQD